MVFAEGQLAHRLREPAHWPTLKATGTLKRIQDTVAGEGRRRAGPEVAT